MPYFQLRINISENRTQVVVRNSFRMLIRSYKIKNHSCGFEELNKYGEPCDPHFHFNFYVEIDRVNPKRCIQDKLRRWYEANELELKGNKQWSLQIVEEPDDYFRWLRYPLKEKRIKELCGVELTEDRWEELENLAKQERKDTIEKNILQREKIRNKDNFKLKIYGFINKVYEYVNKEEITDKMIWIQIFNFYKTEGRPINFGTIDGYVILYKADHGMLTAEDAFNCAKKKNNIIL